MRNARELGGQQIVKLAEVCRKFRRSSGRRGGRLPDEWRSEARRGTQEQRNGIQKLKPACRRTQPAQHGTSRHRRAVVSSEFEPRTPNNLSGPSVTGGSTLGTSTSKFTWPWALRAAMHHLLRHRSTLAFAGSDSTQRKCRAAAARCSCATHVALPSDGVTHSCRSRRVATRDRAAHHS